MTDFPPYTPETELLAASAAAGRPHLRLYRPPAPLVVLGRGSRAEEEVWLARCRQEGVPVVRRRGGGCAVVLDPGVVVVSWCGPRPSAGLPRTHFASRSAWLLDALREIGHPELQQDGLFDLTLEDRKVGGACLLQTGPLLHYSASLLAEADLDRIARLLPHPPREPAYRRGRAHRDFLRNLGSADRLLAALREVLGCQPDPPAVFTT